jgi:hypothetical protein
MNTDIELKKIEHSKLIHDYFEKMIMRIINNCHDVQEQKNVSLDPHVIYGHIIHSSKFFKDSIISVDLDLNAWYYTCELTDFDSVANFYDSKGKSAEKERLNSMKMKFSTSYQARRRIDLTYNISANMITRINDPIRDSIGRVGTVRRLIVLEKDISQLTEKELVIFAFFKRITDLTNNKIWNRYLVKSGLRGSAQENELKNLQDIVLFDGEIAYKEYLMDKDGTIESTIITNQNEITKYKNDFNNLFNKGNEIYEIFE